MSKSAANLLGWLTVAALLGGCAVGQSQPPPPRPFGEIVREERATIISVVDSHIDLRTGTSRSVPVNSPRIPVGPVALRVPIQLGGEKRGEVPAEEITVRLSTGKLVMIVQQLNSPPFAVGEMVRVQYERPSEVSGAARSRVVRE